MSMHNCYNYRDGKPIGHATSPLLAGVELRGMKERAEIRTAMLPNVLAEEVIASMVGHDKAKEFLNKKN